MLFRHGRGRTFVAVPCYGRLSVATAFSLLKLADRCEIGCLVGNCHVDDARNLLVSVFLETDCEQLLFVDADTAVEDLTGFLDYEGDVVGAATPKKSDGAGFACNPLAGPIWADEEGLIDVHDVGTGILKISRKVLTTLFERSRKYNHEGRTVAEVFNREIVGGERLSGDLNFCRKWRELGGQIKVAPEVRVSHSGEKVWQGSYGGYLRRMNGIALQRGVERIRTGQYEREDVIALIEEWGNEDFSAGHELLAVCIEVAQQAQGPIIETGSGLTSLVMAATGAEVHAIEDDPAWASAVIRARDRLGLDTLIVHSAPLVDYPAGRWYEQTSVPWSSADIVLCDGPARTKGDRSVLFRFLSQYGAQPRCVLIDDPDEPEMEGYEFETTGVLKPFAIGRRLREAA